MVTSYEFVLRQARLNWIQNHIVRMFLLNLIALFACLLAFRKHLEFYRFATGVILNLPTKVTWLERLKIARITARNLGIYEIVCRYGSDREVVLADEGTLHIAHYLFVHSSFEPNMNDLETFIRLVSLPDVAVYIKQPESVLIARTKARTHKRIPDGASHLVERFIKHGVSTFDKLVEFSILESRMLVVNGGECKIPASKYRDDPLLGIALKILDFGVEP